MKTIKKFLNNIKKGIIRTTKFLFSDNVINASRTVAFYFIMAMIVVLNLALAPKVYADGQKADKFTIEGVEIWKDACSIMETNGLYEGYECFKWSSEVPTTTNSKLKYIATSVSRNVFDKYNWEVILENQDITTFLSSKDISNMNNYNGKYYVSPINKKIYYSLKENGDTRSWYEVMQYVPNWISTNETIFKTNNVFDENNSTNYFLENENNYNKYNSVKIDVNYTNLNDSFKEWVFSDQTYSNSTYDPVYGVQNSLITDNSGKNDYSIKFEYKLQTLGTSYRSKDINGKHYGEEGFDTTSYIYKEEAEPNLAYYIFDSEKQKFAKYVINTKEDSVWAEEIDAEITNETVLLPLNNKFNTEIKKYYEYKQQIEEKKYRYSQDIYSNTTPEDTSELFYLLTGDYAYKNAYQIESAIIGYSDSKLDYEITWSSNGTTYRADSNGITDWVSKCEFIISNDENTGITCYKTNAASEKEQEIVSTKNTYYYNKYGTDWNNPINNFYDFEDYTDKNYSYKKVNTHLVSSYSKYYANFTVSKGNLNGSGKSGWNNNFNNSCNALNANWEECYNAEKIGYLATAQYNILSGTFIPASASDGSGQKYTDWTSYLQGNYYKDEYGNTLKSLDGKEGLFVSDDDDFVADENHEYIGVNEGVLTGNAYSYEANSHYNVWVPMNEYLYDTSQLPTNLLENNVPNKSDFKTNDLKNLGQVATELEKPQFVSNYYTNQKEYTYEYSKINTNYSYYFGDFESSLDADNASVGFDEISKKGFYNGQTIYWYEPFSYYGHLLYEVQYMVKVKLYRSPLLWEEDYEEANHGKIDQEVFLPYWGYYNGSYFSVYDYIKELGKGADFCDDEGNNYQKALCSVKAYKSKNLSDYYDFDDFSGRMVNNIGIWTMAEINSTPTIYELKTVNKNTYVNDYETITLNGNKFIGPWSNGVNKKGETIQATKLSTTKPSHSNTTYCGFEKRNGIRMQVCYYTSGYDLLWGSRGFEWKPTSKKLLNDALNIENGEAKGELITTKTKTSNQCFYNIGNQEYTGFTTTENLKCYSSKTSNAIYKFQKYKLITNDGSPIGMIDYNPKYLNEDGTYDSEKFIWNYNSDYASQYVETGVYDGFMENDAANTCKGFDYCYYKIGIDGVRYPVESYKKDSAKTYYRYPIYNYSVTNTTQTLDPSYNKYIETTATTPMVQDGETVCIVKGTNGLYSINTDPRCTNGKRAKIQYVVSENTIKDKTKWYYAYEKYAVNKTKTGTGTDSGIDVYAWDLNKLKPFEKLSENFTLSATNPIDYSSTTNLVCTGTTTLTCYNKDSVYYTDNYTQEQLYEYNEYGYKLLSIGSIDYYDEEVMDLIACQNNYKNPLHPEFGKECYEITDSSVKYKYQLYKFDNNSILGREVVEPKKYYYLYTAIGKNNTDTLNGDKLYTDFESKNEVSKIYVQGHGDLPLCSASDFTTSPLECLLYHSQEKFDKYEQYNSYKVTTSTGLYTNSYYDEITTDTNGKVVSYKENRPEDEGYAIKLKNEFNYIEWYKKLLLTNGTKTINSNGNILFSVSKNTAANVSYHYSLAPSSTYVLTIKNKLSNITGTIAIISPSGTLAGSKLESINTLTFTTDNSGYFTIDIDLNADADNNGELEIEAIQIETKENYDANPYFIYAPYQTLVSGNVKYQKLNEVKTEYNYYTYKAEKSTWYDQDSSIQSYSKDGSTGYADIDNYYFGSTLQGSNALNENDSISIEDYDIDLSKFDSTTTSFIENNKCTEDTCRFERTGRYVKRLYHYYAVLDLVYDNGGSEYFEVNEELDYVDENSTGYFGMYLSTHLDTNKYIYYNGKYYAKERTLNGLTYEDVIYNLYRKYEDAGSWRKITFTSQEELDFFKYNYFGEKISLFGSFNDTLDENKTNFEQLEHNSFVINKDSLLTVELYYKDELKTTYNNLEFQFNNGTQTGKYKFVIKVGDSTLTSKEFYLNSYNTTISVTSTVTKQDTKIKYSNILFYKTNYPTNELLINFDTLSGEVTLGDEQTKAGEFGFVLKGKDVIQTENGIHETSKFCTGWYQLENYKVGEFDETKYTCMKYKFVEIQNSTQWFEYELFKDEGKWNKVESNFAFSDGSSISYFVYEDEFGNRFEGWYKNKDEFIEKNFLTSDVAFDIAEYTFDSAYVLTNQNYKNVDELGNEYNTGNELYLLSRIERQYALKETGTSTILLDNIYSFSDFGTIDLMNTHGYDKNIPVDDYSLEEWQNGVYDEYVKKYYSEFSARQLEKVTSFYSSTSQLKNYKLFVQPISSIFSAETNILGGGSTYEVRLYNEAKPYITEAFLTGLENKTNVVPEHLMINRGLVTYSYSTVVDYSYECSNNFKCLYELDGDKLRETEKSYTGVIYDYYTLAGIYNTKHMIYSDYYDFMLDVLDLLEIYVEEVISQNPSNKLEVTKENLKWYETIADSLGIEGVGNYAGYDLAFNTSKIENRFANMSKTLIESGKYSTLLSKASTKTARTNGTLDKYMYLFRDDLIEQFFNSSLMSVMLEQKYNANLDATGGIFEDNHYFEYDLSPLRLHDLLVYEGSDTPFKLFMQSLANLSRVSKKWNGSYYTEAELETKTFFDLLRSQYENYSDENIDTIAIENDGVYYIYKKDVAPFYLNAKLTESRYSDVYKAIVTDGKITNTLAALNIFGAADGTFDATGSNGNLLFASALSLGNSIPRYTYDEKGNTTGTFEPWSYIVYNNVVTGAHWGEDADEIKNEPTKILTHNFITKTTAFDYNTSLYQTNDEEKQVCEAIKGKLEQILNEDATKNLLAEISTADIKKAYGNKMLNFEEMLEYGKNKCGYAVAETVSLWYKTLKKKVANGTFDLPTNEEIYSSDFEAPYINVSTQKISYQGFVRNLASTRGTETALGGFAIGVWGSSFNFAEKVLQYGGSSIITLAGSIVDYGEQGICAIFGLFGGDCAVGTKYDALLYTHRTANHTSVGYYIGDKDKEGTLLLIDFDTKELYNKNIYDSEHKGYTFNTTFNAPSSEKVNINNSLNPFVIKYADTNALDGKNNLEIYLSRLDIQLDTNEQIIAEDISSSTVEYTLYYQPETKEGCDVGFKLHSDGLCYLRSSKLIDHNVNSRSNTQGKMWTFNDDYKISFNDETKTISYTFGRNIFSNDGNDIKIEFMKEPILIDSLVPNQTYTFELRVRTQLGDHLTTSNFQQTFTTTPDMVNNPYGSNFESQSENFKTDDDGKKLDLTKEIFEHNDKVYTNADWMGSLISVEAKNAFWRYDVKDEKTVSSCNLLTDELTKKFCNTIPEKYKIKHHSQGLNEIIGLKIEFEGIDVSNAEFAIDTKVGGTPVATTSTSEYFKSTEKGLEFLNLEEIFGEDFISWKNTNPTTSYIEYILDYKYNIRVIINNGVFTNLQSLDLKWQYYYAPVYSLYYMDYNQNNEFTTTSYNLEGMYDFYGRDASNEFYEMIQVDNARYNDTKHSIDQDRKYCEFNYNGVKYAYIAKYKDGKPYLTY